MDQQYLQQLAMRQQRGEPLTDQERAMLGQAMMMQQQMRMQPAGLLGNFFGQKQQPQAPQGMQAIAAIRG
jgi:hypothetical protein